MCARLLLLVWLLPLCAGARERVLHSPGQHPRGAEKVGRWVEEPGLVRPDRTQGHWLVDPGEASRANLSLRARFSEPRRGLDATLALRVRTDRTGQKITDAVGIEILGRRVRVVEWRKGRRRERPTRLTLRRSRNLETLEVTVALFGEHLVANFWDVDEQRLLGNLLIGGLAEGAGRVGVIGGRQWGGPAALYGLWTRAPCEEVPFADPDLAPLIVTLSPDDAPRARRHGLVLEPLEEEPPRVAFRTDFHGLERLHCDQVKVGGLMTRVPWKYLDRHYLASKEAAPSPTGEGFRIDQSYKNNEMVEALLRGWLTRYPKRVRLATLGTSHEGRPIYAVAIGNDVEHAVGRPTLLLNGAHHGDEPLSTEFVLDAIQVLLETSNRDPRARRWLDEWVVWAVPIVNPDGNHHYLERSKSGARKNGRDLDRDGARGTDEGVDLNRNYPFRWGRLGERGSKSDGKSRYYRGAGPASEPETRAMMALCDRERFAASISFHTGTIAVLAPYTIPGVRNPERNEAWSVATELVAKLPPHPQHRTFVVKKNLYAVDGTDQDWFRHAHGTLALLVEGALFTPLDMRARTDIVHAVRPSWQFLLDRLIDGPAVSGRVVDSEGTPVHAEVTVLETAPRAGERWMTRCRDGRFDRYLPGPGRYTVEVRARGHGRIRRTINATEGSVWLDVRLPRRARRAVCPRARAPAAQ